MPAYTDQLFFSLETLGTSWTQNGHHMEASLSASLW